jgi:hypothetical protein
MIRATAAPPDPAVPQVVNHALAVTAELPLPAEVALSIHHEAAEVPRRHNQQGDEK